MTNSPSIVSQFFQKRQIISEIERGLITDVFDLPDFARKSPSIAHAFFCSPLTLGGDFGEFSISVQQNSKIASLALSKDITVLLSMNKNRNEESKWNKICASLDEDIICNGLIQLSEELTLINKGKDPTNLDDIVTPSRREKDLLDVLPLLGTELSSKPKIAKVILANWPERYLFMSKDIQDNEEFTRLAIAQKGRLMRKASDRLRRRVDLWEIALIQDNSAMTSSKNVIATEERELLSSKDTLIRLLKINGDLLRSTPNNDLLDDIDVVRTAITQDPYAFQYASERLKNDRELQWITFLQVPHAIYDFFKESFDEPDDNRMIEFSQLVKMKSATHQDDLIQAYSYFDNYNYAMDKIINGETHGGSSAKFDYFKLGGDYILNNLSENSLNSISELKSVDAKELLEAEKHRRSLLNIDKKLHNPTSKKRSRTTLLP